LSLAYVWFSRNERSGSKHRAAFFWAYFVEDQPFYFSAEIFYLIIHFGTKPCHQEIFAFINVIVQNHSYLD